jgi:trehalose 6-phosphate synthase/phosphatase
MFRILKASTLPEENVFAVTVGPSSKQTLAKWHVLDPADVLSIVGMVTNSLDDKDASIIALLNQPSAGS